LDTSKLFAINLEKLLLPEFCTQITRSEDWGQVTEIDLARRLLR